MHHIARPVWIIASCVRCESRPPRVFCAFRGPRPATSDDCLALDSCDLPHAQPRRVYSTTSKYTPYLECSSVLATNASRRRLRAPHVHSDPQPAPWRPAARSPPAPRPLTGRSPASCLRPAGGGAVRAPARAGGCAGAPAGSATRDYRARAARPATLGADSGDPREVLGVRSPSPAASSHWCSPWPTSPSCASSSPSSASARTP